MGQRRVGTFATFAEADKVRQEYLARGYGGWGSDARQQVKVQRVGQFKEEFAVKVRENSGAAE